MILTPYGHVQDGYSTEALYSEGGDGSYLCPHDPYQNQRGEAGFYHDTQLGGAGQLGYIPTDAMMADVYGYLPVNSGWVPGTTGEMVPSPWRPPTNATPPGALPWQVTNDPAPVGMGPSKSLQGTATLHGTATPRVRKAKPAPFMRHSLRGVTGRFGDADATPVPTPAAYLPAVPPQSSADYWGERQLRADRRIETIQLFTAVAIGVAALTAVIRTFSKR